ncbi:TetR family transcriptional regulator C-terminal domain-containing protein [Leuconostoc citreum]|nr:TetR-like C-terminal domain-containing protein [Leuconostoc citreum]MCK8604563.1 TetR family transcriptional regulator C-terminal domain-containing protein [Leuconostoc citreum]
MVQSVVVTIDDDVTPLLAQDLVDFYGSAIASQIIKWLLTDCDTPKDILVSRATAILDGTIEFIINKNKHTSN